MHKSFFGTVLRGAAVSAGVLVFAAGAAAQDTTTLQLLHATDLEGNADAVESAPNFATIVDALEDTHPTTLIISSGDKLHPEPVLERCRLAGSAGAGGARRRAQTR